MEVPEDELVRLITDLKTSLIRQIRGLGDSLTRELREGFEQMNIRLDEQAALLDEMEQSSSDWPLP